MGAVIQNDLCREVYNLDNNPTIGTSKLLAIGPIILKLFEANLWYSQVGNKKLRELAEKCCVLAFVENEFKEMKLLDPNRIEKYARFRNKLAGHYDSQILDVIQELGLVQYNIFWDDVEMMVLYGQKWLQVLRSIYWKLPY